MIFTVSLVQSSMVDGRPESFSPDFGASIGVVGNMLSAICGVSADVSPERLQLVDIIGEPTWLIILSRVGVFGMRMPMVPFCMTCGAKFVFGFTRRIRLSGPGINFWISFLCVGER